MKAIHLSALGAGVVVIAGTLLANACDNVPQPKIGCTIGQGPFAAKYTPKAGQAPVGTCAANKGETISVRDYTNPDAGTNSIAIRTTLMGSETRTDLNPDHKPYSFGDYPSQSNDQSFCVAGAMNPAIQQIPADATKPAVDRKYEWTNVRFLVTPRAPGTQMAADLKFTDNISGCSIEYDVVGMWPSIGCGKKDPSTGLNVPDDTKCATVTDADAGTKIACSGAGCVSPDFKIHCDPDILLCVLDQPPPSLK